MRKYDDLNISIIFWLFAYAIAISSIRTIIRMRSFIDRIILVLFMLYFFSYNLIYYLSEAWDRVEQILISCNKSYNMWSPCLYMFFIFNYIYILLYSIHFILFICCCGASAVAYVHNFHIPFLLIYKTLLEDGKEW